MARTTKDAVSSVEADQYVAGVVGDTQASNTGQFSGMFRQLEDLLQRPLLKVPCRHHSDDLMEKTSFKEVFGPTKSPARTDFLNFRKKWPTLDLKSITPARNTFTHPFLLNALDNLKQKCYKVLQDPAVRSDRKELAQQTLDVNGFAQPR